MHSVNKLRATGAHRRKPCPTENHPRPALGVRIWTWLLTALHESREQEAARVIRRYRDLIQNFQAIELPGRGMDPKTMPDRRIGLRGRIGRIFIAALIVSLALALGFALNELDAAVRDACASLAAIATIGN
jgi:hypothetical protein